MKFTCRHCAKPIVNTTRRGLCAGCYNTRLIRDQYPAPSPTACGTYRGIDHGNKQGELPEPTEALPGSPEKLQVLMRRARRGEKLFHAKDRPR